MHLRGVRDESKVYSATGNGKIPWVSADDIAAVAVRTLTDEKSHNTDYLVLGSELLSYDEVSPPTSHYFHSLVNNNANAYPRSPQSSHPSCTVRSCTSISPPLS